MLNKVSYASLKNGLVTNVSTVTIAGMFGRDDVWQKWMDEDFGKKVRQINISAKRLLIVTNNLDGFSLTNC